VDRRLTQYRDALDALFARTGGTSKFGLERTRDFLALLGNPHEKLKCFHVAGTNGKGSVVITIYALLRAKGMSVGRYMSPHLIDFRERIVVDDIPVSEEYVFQFLHRWGPSAERMGATFFEITTAMAFHYFASRGVDVAVIETGLGGRLDSTNVITPLVSGITSIGMDHQEYLGNTEVEIAREKAGILKAGVPAVIGPLSTDARVAIYEAAQKASAAAIVEASRLYRTANVQIGTNGTSFAMTSDSEHIDMTTGLTGSAQADNAAVAMAMLRSAGSPWITSLEDASQVLPQVRLPGRFQRLGNCIFDVAHNADGMRSLLATLGEIAPPRPIVAVLGVLKDKDWQEMMRALSQAVDRIILVSAPTAPPDRVWNPEAAEMFATAAGIEARFDQDFNSVVRASRDRPGTTLITGSFHTVGDALHAMGEKTV
jgi:dihydrofolate synthase/folylpolyglutamate synthase